MSAHRRYRREGVYFPDMVGLHAALVDAGQLMLCLDALLQSRGLLDVELVPRRGPSGHRQLPAVSVRDAIRGLHSAAEVFRRAAQVAERAEQAVDQVGLLFDAAEASNDDEAVSRCMDLYDVCTRIAAGMAPVRREKLTAARAALRAAEGKKARGEDGDGRSAG